MSRMFDINGDGYSYDFNPYYNPETCGLTILGVLDDPDASYSFDTVVVWIDNETNTLLAARDSGCSCPSPFEDYRGTGDMTPVRSWDDVAGLIDGGYVTYDSAEKFALRRKVETFLGGVKLANQAVEEFRELYLTPQIAPCDPGAGSAVEEELRERVAELEESRAAAWDLNDYYLTVIRDQGQFIEFIKQAIVAFRRKESAG